MWIKIISIFVSSSILTVCILKKYFGGQYCKCKNRLDGKVIIVTGGNSGIGKEAAIILASKGAELILACRDIKKGHETASEIKVKTGNTFVRSEQLDLSHFGSIIDFVNRFKQTGTKLYGLLNNAGLFYAPFELTEDGFDVTLQTNYLGPFLLTHLLLNRLKDNRPSRIVNLGSESHRFPTELDVKNLTKHYDYLNQFDPFMRYGISKLCLTLFTSKLAKLLYGNGVTVNIVNPGNVRTDIYRSFPVISELRLLSLSRFLLWLTFKTPYQGAQTVVHLLSNQELSVSGKYYSECTVADVCDLAKSTFLEDNLWESTLTLLHPFLNDNETKLDI